MTALFSSGKLRASFFFCLWTSLHPHSIIIKTKYSSAAEQGVVHVDIAGIVVGVRVPEAARAHPDPLAPLLADDHLHHDLVSVVAQGLHLALHVVSDGLGPLRHLGRVINLPSQLLIEATMNNFLQRI